jgi:uncharacterized membrane protein YvbJ
MSGNCSTCFEWYFHPSSGAHTTLSTASGICHNVTAICRYCGRVGTGLSVLWVAFATHSTEDNDGRGGGKRRRRRWMMMMTMMIMMTIIIIMLIIIIIIGATGAMSKSFRKYVSNVPGNHEVKEL